MTRAGSGRPSAPIIRGGLVMTAAVLVSHALSLWWERGTIILLDIAMIVRSGCF